MGTGIIKEILTDHWDEFDELYGYRTRDVVKKEVKKIIKCGSLDNGYIEYECPSCKEVKKVGFRCRSRFCNSCGKVYVDNRAENMVSKLVNSVHRHMVFTIPQELRKLFQKNRKLLSLLPKCAADTLKSWFEERNKKEKYTPGIVAVIHTFGRDLKWNPHVHILVTEGAAGESVDWLKVSYIPYDMLRKRWQKLLLDGLTKEVGKRNIQNLKNKLYRRNKDGFYVHAKPKVKNEKAATQYVGRYTGRPAIAQSRIRDYDGEKVTFYYDDHNDGKRKEVTLDAIEFIKKLVIHIPEKQFKMIRYYGIYGKNAKPREKLIMMKSISDKVKEFKRKQDNWRVRIMKAFGHDPLKCEKCGKTMVFSDVYSKKYGRASERYRRRILAEAKKEIEDFKEAYNTVKHLSKGEIEPMFA